MAYDTNELKQRALKIVPKKGIYFIEDLCIELGIDKVTYYAHKLNEDNDIKKAMLTVRQNVKRKLRGKWYESDNATLQLLLYKLLASQSELDRMSYQKTNTQITGEVKTTISVEKALKLIRDQNDRKAIPETNESGE